MEIERLGQPYDPTNQALYVSVEDGEERYIAPFVTPRFITQMFKKNEMTSECLNGSYFCMPGMVVIKDLHPDRIRVTIDALIENHEFEQYFKKAARPTARRA
jgi:hypothetical protein